MQQKEEYQKLKTKALWYHFKWFCFSDFANLFQWFPNCLIGVLYQPCLCKYILDVQLTSVICCQNWSTLSQEICNQKTQLNLQDSIDR